MAYPIVAYGHPVLRKIAKSIDKDYPNLNEIIENMKETMHEAPGVGLAAPQVNLSIRLIVMDAGLYKTDYPEVEGFNRVLINPRIVKEEGEEWEFNEACLSLPGLAEYVMRKPIITLKYQDENFDKHEEVIDGMAARIIQHEHDHLEGILFIDHVSSLKKVLLKNKLYDISTGEANAAYKMALPPIRKKKRLK